ncbi:MAG: undecaprenyl-diphosphatase [Clostridiales bacterium GWE2_32_10]|nr:MAG: undecaprenyl-diphosphatase [Clostridiales bacterium GWE2_32_10]HBY20265.1 undecaprenyl-diphosphatase [Clostridiales bacterium]
MELIIQAIILGIVEGITEFLPVSSTGHLILFGDFIGFKKGDFSIMFDVIIQLGAILAVLVYYRKKIWESLKNIKPGEWGFKLWFKIFIAFLPAAALGFLLNDYIDEYLFSNVTVSIALIIGAIFMIVVEKYFANKTSDEITEISTKKSLFIGFAQCMALIPGMSRSASTIMGGMIVGLSVKVAAEFSFFLAIPTMFAATGYSIIKGFAAMGATEWIALSVGFVTSFIVAFIVIGKFLSFLTKHSLKPFAYYRLIVGILMLILIANNLV